MDEKIIKRQLKRITIGSAAVVVLLLELFPAPLELLSVDDVLLLDDVPDDGVVAGVLAGASGPTNTTLSRLR